MENDAIDKADFDLGAWALEDDKYRNKYGMNNSIFPQGYSLRSLANTASSC